VQRLRLAERTISIEIDTLLNGVLSSLVAQHNQAHGKVLTEVDRQISIVNYELSALRREQRAAVGALLHAEGMFAKLERMRGILLIADEAKVFVSRYISQVLDEIRRLPDMAETDRERQRFGMRTEAIMSIMRQDVPADKLDVVNGSQDASASIQTKLERGGRFGAVTSGAVG
jgi:hypothetical protein